jgi:hypothetical protein
MFLFIIATTTSSAPILSVEVQTTATIRIQRPAVASSEEWKRSPKSQRKEIVVRDASGKLILLRLVEYQ